MTEKASQTSNNARMRKAPIKYDPKYDIIAADAKQNGIPNKYIAQLLNINESTFYAWIKNHDGFRYALESSQAAFIAANIQKIEEYCDEKKDWRGRAWLLAKADPAEFGEKQSIDMNVNETESGKDEVLNMLEQLKKKRESDSDIKKADNDVD